MSGIGTLFLLGLPGGPELFVILFIALLLFGGAKLPKLARSLGQSITEFKRGFKDGEEEGEPGTLPPDDEKRLPRDGKSA